MKLGETCRFRIINISMAGANLMLQVKRGDAFLEGQPLLGNSPGPPHFRGMSGMISRIQQLARELRRRHVLRVAGAYALVAWVLIQVAVSIFPYIGLPDWAITLVIVLTIAGFPIALVLSWMFQIKPEEAQASRVSAEADVAAGTVMPTIAVTVVVLMLAGGAWLLWQKRSTSAVDSSVVAVLPFAVRGNPDFAYLSAGMVDLLSRNFDEATELRTVDPGTVIESSGKLEAGVPLDLTRARRIAQDINARYFVLGTVTENAGRIRVDAILYDGLESKQVGSAGLEQDAAKLFELIDRVAADLLVDRFGAASQHLARTASVMTSSLDALKFYLRGEQSLRNADYDSAVAFFHHATEADSTFALAYYRLAVTASLYDAWAPVDMRGSTTVSAPNALARARANSNRLGARDRALLQALQAYALGEADEAERKYHAILSQYPDEMEGQFQLANVLYRYNALRGRSPQEARPYYERLFEVDPDFFCPI